jgi:hypothetical protein
MSTPFGNDTFLEDLAASCAARLEAHPYFDNIVVRDEQLGMIADLTAAGLDGYAEKNGAKGVAVVVHFPEVISDQDMGAAGSLLRVKIKIEIYENLDVNRGTGGTGKLRGAVAKNVLALLKGWESAAVYMAQPLASDTNPIRPETRNDGELVLMVSLITSWPVNFLDKVALPTLDTVDNGGGDTITLACATPGAAIYYSLTGNGLPSAVNAAAVLYDGPFNLPASDRLELVRVIAYKDGMTPSDEQALRREARGVTVQQLMNSDGTLAGNSDNSLEGVNP